MITFFTSLMITPESQQQFCRSWFTILGLLVDGFVSNTEMVYFILALKWLNHPPSWKVCVWSNLVFLFACSYAVWLGAVWLLISKPPHAYMHCVDVWMERGYDCVLLYGGWLCAIPGSLCSRFVQFWIKGAGGGWSDAATSMKVCLLASREHGQSQDPACPPIVWPVQQVNTVLSPASSWLRQLCNSWPPFFML